MDFQLLLWVWTVFNTLYIFWISLFIFVVFSIKFLSLICFSYFFSLFQYHKPFSSRHKLFPSIFFLLFSSLLSIPYSQTISFLFFFLLSIPFSQIILFSFLHKLFLSRFFSHFLLFSSLLFSSLLSSLTNDYFSSPPQFFLFSSLLFSSLFSSFKNYSFSSLLSITPSIPFSSLLFSLFLF